VAWLTNGPNLKIKAIVPLAFARQIITGYQEGRLGVWDSLTYKLLYVIHAHRNDVTSFHSLEDQRLLISASLDGRLKFWKFPDTIQWMSSLEVLEEKKENKVEESEQQEQKKIAVDKGPGYIEDEGTGVITEQRQSLDIGRIIDDDEPVLPTNPTSNYIQTIAYNNNTNSNNSNQTSTSISSSRKSIEKNNQGSDS